MSRRLLSGSDTVTLSIKVILFGLTNAPAIFQGYINKILVEKLNVFIIMYLNNILIYTENNGKGYVQAVRWFLTSWENSFYIPIWSNINFIKKKFDS